MIMSFTTTQVLGVGSVCFIALTYRNLDLKYTMNVSERTHFLSLSLSLSLSLPSLTDPHHHHDHRHAQERIEELEQSLERQKRENKL